MRACLVEPHHNWDMESPQSSSRPGRFSPALSSVGLTVGGLIAGTAAAPLWGQFGEFAAAPTLLIGLLIAAVSGTHAYNQSKHGQAATDQLLEDIRAQGLATGATLEQLSQEVHSLRDRPDYRLTSRL